MKAPADYTPDEFLALSAMFHDAMEAEDFIDLDELEEEAEEERTRGFDEEYE